MGKEECDNSLWWDCNYTYTKLDKDNYANLISKGGELFLTFKMERFSAIIDKQDDGIKHSDTELNGDATKVVFEKYYP